MATLPKQDLTKTAEFATATWREGSGNEESLTIEVPDYPSMSNKDFSHRMAAACGQFRGNYAKAGLHLAVEILPGLEDAKRRFAAGEVIDGCKRIEQYIKHLGLLRLSLETIPTFMRGFWR
ncbi:MAG TPA: hypothetical protein VMG82_17820 [Candidatus Sulfotelmatobacter sp.]|nr:hypothetical protein [Candidatus Sulfotelmatobacter sp.]